METSSKTYQCAIIGGGLAGLCLSIQLAKQGIDVILFEKNQYPFHKVCGEYISMESWSFLTELGLPLAELNLPVIKELGISSELGYMLNASLDMGGFGISRYSLENYLYEIAVKNKVTIVQNCRVIDVKLLNNTNQISTSQGLFTSEITCGSYGKYTPAFLSDKENKSSNNLNYIGIKYHIKTDLKTNRIELHNFRNGYCGVSKVEKDWYCLCYLSDSVNIRKNNNDIKQMEENVLYKNSFLKRLFTESEFVNKEPYVISNIQFSKKHTYKNGVFLLGDSAGTITPLCGNGMSMAMKASKLLAEVLMRYFNNSSSSEKNRNDYEKLWNGSFQNRIMVGYYLQYLFGKKYITHYTLKTLDKLPILTKKIISLTHGDIY
jgi:flavin-dependent dehydrogenase